MTEKETHVTFSIRITERLHKQLKEAAKKEDRSVNYLIHQILKESQKCNQP